MSTVPQPNGQSPQILAEEAFDASVQAEPAGRGDITPYLFLDNLGRFSQKSYAKQYTVGRTGTPKAFGPASFKPTTNEVRIGTVSAYESSIEISRLQQTEMGNRSITGPILDNTPGIRGRAGDTAFLLECVAPSIQQKLTDGQPKGVVLVNVPSEMIVPPDYDTPGTPTQMTFQKKMQALNLIKQYHGANAMYGDMSSLDDSEARNALSQLDQINYIGNTFFNGNMEGARNYINSGMLPKLAGIDNMIEYDPTSLQPFSPTGPWDSPPVPMVFDTDLGIYLKLYPVWKRKGFILMTREDQYMSFDPNFTLYRGNALLYLQGTFGCIRLFDECVAFIACTTIETPSDYYNNMTPGFPYNPSDF